MATKKKKTKNPDDKTLALLIQVRDELREANARWKFPEASRPKAAASLEPAAVTITPELEAAIAALRQSVQELERTVKEELLHDRNRGSR